MDGLRQDLRYGFRRWRRVPGVAAIALVVLALGVGATTLMFSLVHGVLLRPLPYPESEELMLVRGAHPKIGFEGASLPDFVDWRQHNAEAADAAFEDLVATTLTGRTLTGAGQPLRLIASPVSAGFFELVGSPLERGRGFLPEEDREGGEKVVVLGHALWQEAFGGEDAVLGTAVNLNGEPHTVVGVAASTMKLPSRADLWVPLAMDPAQAHRRGNFLMVLGRLSPGTTAAGAQAQMDTVTARLAAEYPDTNGNWSAGVIALHEEVVGGTRTPLLALAAAVGFVLLIACANLAHLQLSRGLGRSEVLVRSALGASRWRIARQLLVESLVLAFAGGALGLALAWGGLRVLAAAELGNLPRVEELGLHPGVVLFALGATLFSGLASGLAPALQGSRKDLHTGLRSGGRGGGVGTGQQRLRGALTVAEVALSLMLLTGAGLMVRSLLELQSVDPGFAPQQVLTLRVGLPESGYSENSQVLTFHDRLREQAESLPGVLEAGAVSHLYVAHGSNELGFRIAGRPAPPEDDVQDAQVRSVHGDFLAALGVPLIRGRGLSPDAAPDGVLETLVNEAFVRRYFPEEDPLGQRILFGDNDGATNPDGILGREIVGVIGDVRQSDLAEAPGPEVLLPLTQAPNRTMTLVVRTAGAPLDLAQSLRAEIRSLDPTLPVYAVRSMDQVLRLSLQRPRFTMTLFGAFAALALVLAAVGLYGVLSYAVRQRTREIGVRMALGARPQDIRTLVLRRSLALTGLGLLLGLAGAALLTRFLATLLYGITPTDAVTYAGVTLLFALVALVASLFPAQRAMRVDPVTATRSE